MDFVLDWWSCRVVKEEDLVCGGMVVILWECGWVEMFWGGIGGIFQG